MTDIDITAALALCEAATPAPLWADEEGRGGYNAHAAWYGIAQANDEIEPGVYSIMNKPELMMFKLKADAEFFVAARTGWPAALHALQSARAEVERLRGVRRGESVAEFDAEGRRQQTLATLVAEREQWMKLADELGREAVELRDRLTAAQAELAIVTQDDVAAVALRSRREVHELTAERDAANRRCADAVGDAIASEQRLLSERDAARAECERWKDEYTKQYDHVSLTIDTLTAANASLSARVLELEGELQIVSAFKIPPSFDTLVNAQLERDAAIARAEKAERHYAQESARRTEAEKEAAWQQELRLADAGNVERDIVERIAAWLESNNKDRGVERAGWAEIFAFDIRSNDWRTAATGGDS